MFVTNKLWLDDVRKPPDDTWTWVKSYDEAVQAVEGQWFGIMSLDHDLGMEVAEEMVSGIVVAREREKPTGYDFACYIERRVHMGDMLPPMVMVSHSANPNGKVRIELVARKLTS